MSRSVLLMLVLEAKALFFEATLARLAFLGDTVNDVTVARSSVVT